MQPLAWFTGRPYASGCGYAGPTVAAFLASRPPMYEQTPRVYTQIKHIFFEGPAQPVYVARALYDGEGGEGKGGGGLTGTHTLEYFKMLLAKGQDGLEYSMDSHLRRMQTQMQAQQEALAQLTAQLRGQSAKAPGQRTTDLPSPYLLRPFAPPYAALPPDAQDELAALALNTLQPRKAPQKAQPSPKHLKHSLERQISLLEQELDLAA